VARSSQDEGRRDERSLSVHTHAGKTVEVARVEAVGNWQWVFVVDVVERQTRCRLRTAAKLAPSVPSPTA
jgi:hypothetical protein